MFQIVTLPETRNAFILTGKIPSNARTGMRHGFYKLGSLLRKELKSEILRKPKSGKIYNIRRGVTRRRYRHTASAPGETPANLSGKLRKSVEFKVRGHTEMEFGYDNSVKYGRALELGYKKRNLEARPGIKNAINKKKLDGASILGEEVNKSIKQGL